MDTIYDTGLERNAANYVPVTPLTFLERAAEVYPSRPAIVHGPLRRTWSETYARCRRLASALASHGVTVGDTVAVMLPNTPPMVEAHFGVPDTMQPVPADGETMGEIMFRGNIAMKGYLKNPEATEAAFAGGWFHTGDLAVLHPDGYVKIKDRSKDIIISGGENISSIEVEDVLYRHPAVAAAAVVARPDAKWGEVPCAFVELRPGAEVAAEELIRYCKEHLAGFKVPKAVVFGEIPKTSTGKIQKFSLREQVRSTDALR